MPETKASILTPPAVQRSRLSILGWRLLALLAFVMGLIGAVLPVMPTTPFLIIAAWAAGKGWPAFEVWLLNHRVFGPHIVRWRERGVIPLRFKLFATFMMVSSAIALQFFALKPWVRGVVPLTMLAVATWVWMQPSE